MADAKKLLQTTLDRYDTGLVLTELNFQNVRPPQEVKDAFDDANRALQDKQRLEEEAKAYASQVVPEARGDAAGARAEAEGYKSERIARAEGDAQRFNLSRRNTGPRPRSRANASTSKRWNRWSARTPQGDRLHIRQEHPHVADGGRCPGTAAGCRRHHRGHARVGAK